MKESSLIELFKTLNTKEIKDFSLFLDSPYFDRGKYRKEVKMMFEILVKLVPDGWETADLGKEKIYKKVFPGATFVEGRLEKVMVEFSKSLRGFLLAQRYFGEANWQHTQSDFVEILRERQLIERAGQVARILLDDLNIKKIKDVELYGYLHKVSSSYYAIKTQKNTWREDLNIGQTLRYLDLYYFTNRLRLLNHYFVLSTIAKVDAGIDVEKEKQLSYFFNIKSNESPSTYIAKKIFDLFASKERSIAALEELLDLLNEYEAHISSLDLRLFFSYIRNYCAYLIITTGNDKVPTILYRILRDNLSKGYFHYNGQIPPGIVLNICTYACKFGDFEWVFEFIEFNKSKIMGDNKNKSYYLLCISYCLFYLKKFQDSLDHLPSDLINVDYHMVARCLEIMNYYELGSDLSNFKLDALKMYLSRGKTKGLSDDYYEQYKNFTNLLYQIIQSKPGAPKRKELLLERIQEKPQLAFRDWLIAKVKELK